jgi:transposase InsO family protein
MQRVTPEPHAVVSRLVGVLKPDGSVRFCYDAGVNAATIISAESRCSMPGVENTLSLVAGRRFLGKLDLRDAFRHVGIPPALRKYFTIRVTVDGEDRYYQYTTMPFGWSMAPILWQACLTEVLADFIAKNVVGVYIDDILLVADTEDQFVALTKAVLERLVEKRLRINAGKCTLGVARVMFLGYEVDGETIQLSQSRLQYIEAMPEPQNLPELRSVLGIFQNLSPHVEGAAHFLAVLSDATKGEAARRWKDRWMEKQQEAFKALKRLVMSALPRHHHDPTRTLVLRTDASGLALGWALYQLTLEAQKRHDEGETLAFAEEELQLLTLGGCKLSPTEAKYSAQQREALAIVTATDKLNPFLWGRRFYVVTDHRNLLWMRDSVNEMVRRWAMKLGRLDFQVVYRPGVQNVVADAVSRLPAPEGLGAPPEELVVLLAHAPSSDGTATPSLARRIAAAQKASGKEFKEEDGFNRGTRGGIALAMLGGLAWVPAEATGLQQDILQAAHAESGHGGQAATLDAVHRAGVTWPKLAETIARHLRCCDLCARNRSWLHNRRQGLFHAVRGDRPFARWIMDYLGPVVDEEGRSHYILVCVDTFSRFTLLTHATEATAAVTVAALERLVEDYGVPEVIQSDNGSHFANGAVAAFMQSQGIAHHLSAPHNPQSNAVGERRNAVIMRALRTLPKGARDDMHRAVHKVQSLVNTTLNTAIGVTPFEAIFGLVPSTGLTAAAGAITSSEGGHTVPQLRAMAREMVQLRDELFIKRARAAWDAKHTEVHFNPGDIVMLTLKQPDGKLGDRNEGPFRVLGPGKGENVYRLEDVNGTRTTEAHVRRMQPYDESRTSAEALLESKLPAGYAVVDKVLRHRFGAAGNGALEVEVSWRDSPASDTRWLPWQEAKKLSAVTAYISRCGLDLTQAGTLRKRKPQAKAGPFPGPVAVDGPTRRNPPRAARL